MIGVCGIALPEKLLPRVEPDPLAHEGQQLQLCRLNLGEKRHAPK
jgi:hypothetical protein